MLITHIELAVVGAFCDQRSINDIAPDVFRPNKIAILVIVKNRFRTDFTACRIFNRSKLFAVVVEIHGSLQRLVNYLSLRNVIHF